MSSDEIPSVYSVVVGIDYSEISALALKEAVVAACAHGQSHIHVVHALPAPVPMTQYLGMADPSLGAALPVPPAVAALEPEAARALQNFLEQTLRDEPRATSTGGSLRWTTHLRQSDAAHALAQLASDVQANLIVVGTHGRQGLARFLLGSVAEAVVRLAPCPVLVVRPIGAQPEAPSVPIEPPCPDCLETRRATRGQEFWCERHRVHHGRAHTYHFSPFRDSHQSGLLIHPKE